MFDYLYNKARILNKQFGLRYHFIYLLLNFLQDDFQKWILCLKLDGGETCE